MVWWLSHLDHDTLPFFTILSCKPKSARWIENFRLPTCVVFLRNDPILKRIFANILVTFRFDFKCLWAVFSKTFVFSPTLSSRSSSVHQMRFHSIENTWVLSAIAIFRSYFSFAHVSFWHCLFFLVHLSQFFFRSITDIISWFCSIISFFNFSKFSFTATQYTTQPNTNASHDTSKTMDDNDNDSLRSVWPGRDGAITQGYSVPTPRGEL